MPVENKPKQYKWNPTGLTELRVNSEKNKPKLYKPEKKVPSLLITLLLINIIGGGFYVFAGYDQMPFKRYLFLSSMMILGIYSSLHIIYNNISYCIYVETTEEEIAGKNWYKMKKNVIKFNEIKEMWITKWTYVLHLKDIHGKKLGILFRYEFVLLLKEILEKSENCTKIDIDYDYFMKQKLYKRYFPEIKPLLDRRLAESGNYTIDSISKENDNSNQMSEENKPKLHKPEDIYSPWFMIITIAINIVGFYIMITDYWGVLFKRFLFLPLLVAGSILYGLVIIYYDYAYCTYVETTEDEMFGKSKHKMKRGIIKFNEIREIWITKFIPVIHLKGRYGKKLGISFKDGMVPLLKEILEKSENCTKINIDYNHFIKKKLYQFSEIKPILDKKLAEIKGRKTSING